MASASLPSSGPPRKYDVFLSYRGVDTGSGFSSYLYDRLLNRGIKTFADVNLKTGDPISSILLTAIEESRFAIVVLSENYASSTWCLEELTKILECSDTNNTQVLPLFYQVDPSDVRYHRTSFKEAFTRYEYSGRHEPEKVMQWRNALHKVASFFGWDSRQYKSERELVEDVVKSVCSKLLPVEIESTMTEFMDETSPPGWKYDVFLNYRGYDVRRGILSHLYHELQSRGIKIFSSDQDLEVGDAISNRILTAIEQSRFAIVVLSENYASSTMCLEELTKILQCRETNNTQVLPLFYNVDPSGVRFQRKSFKTAFTWYEYSARHEPEKVRQWSDALHEVANITGWDSCDYQNESKLVKAIVEYVCSEIPPIETEYTMSTGDCQSEITMSTGDLETEFTMSTGDLETEFTMSTADFETEFTMSMGDFEAFKATRQAMIEVMKAVKDDEVTAVGVYGMEGVGKTTMVKLVAAQASNNGIFNQVIIAVVSQSPGLRKIQGGLAEQLGFELKEKTEIGRAARLSKEIMRRGKILIILDDVWNRIEWSDIGIPSSKELQNCKSKVLLTTKIHEVCHTMVQEKIILNVLSEEDSWTLFEKNARCFESTDFHDAGRNVARECCGLPIALIAVARALGDKDWVEWEKAAQRLNKYIRDDLEDEGDFQWIKLSYDYLPNEDCKSCFLLCCLFPYDSDIPIEDLFTYAIGNGLFRDADIKEARGTFDSVATHLKHSSLLLDGEKKGCVRMRYIIRKIAIKIAKSEYGDEFFIKAESGLKDRPSRTLNINLGCQGDFVVDVRRNFIKHSGRWQGYGYSCGGGNADNRSLLLCVAEYEGGKVSYVILGVKLCDILFTSSASPSQKSQLRRLAEFSGDNLPFCMGCGVWRSKILLGGGTKPRYAHLPFPSQPVMGHFYHCPARQIYSFEKHSDRGDPNPNVACIPFQKKMLRGNVQPLLVELDDKLYALGKSVTGASFEVFDPNNNGWSSLPYPPVNCPSYPFSIGDSRAIFDQYFAVAGKKILVSDGITSHWFDTTDPKQGWRGLDRFSFIGSTVIVDDGEQFVLFLFKPSDSDAQHISVHLISYNFDSIQRDYSSVPLPTDFSKYRPDHLGDFPLTNYTLVHLGGNTVCLVVSEQKKTFRCVAFDFQVKVGDEAAPSLKINFLHTPMLVYEDIDMDMASGHMLGAFLL